MKRFLTTILLTHLLCLLLLCVAFLAPLHAQIPIVPAPSATVVPSEDAVGLARAPVTVNGRKVFEIADESDAEAKRRAETVEKRLERLITRDAAVAPFVPRDVLIQGGQPLIMLGGEPILTITDADVEDTLTPAPELAQLWGGQLAEAVRLARIARTGPLSNAYTVLLTSAHDLLNSFASWLPRLLGVLLLALLFWPLAKLARWMARKATQSPRIDPNLTQLSIAIAFYGVWGLGMLTMLSAMGINSAGIAAAVGASGFVLGFAFQDVLSHFLAGMMLLMSRQFYIGGRIKVGEHEGFVEGIDLRALYLRTYDNRQVTIPNGQVFNSAVIVNTSNPWQRREFVIGIGYESDMRRAMALATETMQSVDGVLKDPAPMALVDDLGSSSVDLKMYFFTDSADTRWLKIRSECIARTKEAFDENDINIPFSMHTVDVRHIGDLAGLGAVIETAQDAANSPQQSD